MDDVKSQANLLGNGCCSRLILSNKQESQKEMQSI